MTGERPAARGAWAERLALAYLRTHGLDALGSNYRCRWGEIDLIMRERSTVVFVEVRYRSSSHYGSGADSVDRSKRRKLIATAREYLQHNASLSRHPCRFDVVSVSPSRHREDARVEWIRHAFEP